MKQQKLTRKMYDLRDRSLMLDLLVCDNCGILTYQVYVHGHYQCNDCKVVSDPCCSGEHAYLSNSARDSGVKVNDQENIKRVKERVDYWLTETNAEKASQ